MPFAHCLLNSIFAIEMSKFRKNILSLLVAFATAFITGCYEASDFDAFGSGNQSVVIEACITDTDSLNTIIISKSVPASDTTDCEYVDDAVVMLRDDMGNSAEVIGIGNGRYKISGFIGKPGHDYLLTAEIDGFRYSSIDRMPSASKIDSVIVEFKDNRTLFDTIGYYITVLAPQTSDTTSYYRITVEQNGVPLDNYSNLWIYEDTHKASIFKMTVNHNFETGDSVVVKVYSLSENVYEYFFGLSKQFSTTFSNIQPPLTNPDNNINPTALGCFQASPVKVFRFVVGNKARTIVRL